MGNSTNNGPSPTGDVPPQEWIAQMFARLEVPLVGCAARHLRGGAIPKRLGFASVKG